MDEAKEFFKELSDEDGQSIRHRADSPQTEPRSQEEGEEGQLAIDVYREGNDIIVESPIAGVDPEALDVHITNESVTVRGSRMRRQEIQDEDYYYQECYWGKFSRSVILPQEVDAEASEASIRNGVLHIRMPMIDRKKGKKLKVRMG